MATPPDGRMWRGYEEALGAYGIAICREWQRRGRAETCADKITDDLAAAGPAVRLARTGEIG